MQYISGILAFGVECECKSVGRWNTTKREFLDTNLFKFRESDESPFKDWGIEKNKIVPYHEFHVVNVANHVRAYVDMLYDKEFEFLEDAFAKYIDDAECRKDIFMLVYGRLRNLVGFREINEFMCKEFGNAWVAYVDSVHSVAEHISNRADAIEQLEELQASIGKK